MSAEQGRHWTVGLLLAPSVPSNSDHVHSLFCVLALETASIIFYNNNQSTLPGIITEGSNFSCAHQLQQRRARKQNRNQRLGLSSPFALPHVAHSLPAEPRRLLGGDPGQECNQSKAKTPTRGFTIQQPAATAGTDSPMLREGTLLNPP